MEAKFSPDTQGGHQATNNHFSTSKMDDEVSDRLSTVTDVHDETTVTTSESLSSIGDDHHEISVLPEVPTTHKLDAKKDPKKKVKPLLKKKEKTFEFEESPDTSSFHTVDETTTNRIIDTTTTSRNLDITTRVDTTSHNLDTTTTSTNAPDMTTVEETTFSVRSDILHKSMDMESTTMTHADVETAPTESSVPTTTKNENLLSSDEQPPQTTIHENSMESTATKTTPFPTEAQETEIQTTQLPTTIVPETESPEISNGLSIMKNDEDISSSDAHFHTDDELAKPEEVPTLTTAIPTTPEESSKSDNNNMSNDLQDTQTTTSMSIDFAAEVTTIRKQKQMNLEGGCPCNERGTSLDPSECVGGRTAADPNCPCREVCARQSGQSCSPGEPCDEEFGLHCNPQNNTCTGKCFFLCLYVTY